MELDKSFSFNFNQVFPFIQSVSRFFSPAEKNLPCQLCALTPLLLSPH